MPKRVAVKGPEYPRLVRAAGTRVTLMREDGSTEEDVDLWWDQATAVLSVTTTYGLMIGSAKVTLRKKKETQP